MACVEECESRWSSSRVYVLTQPTVINARTVDAFLRTHTFDLSDTVKDTKAASEERRK